MFCQNWYHQSRSGFGGFVPPTPRPAEHHLLTQFVTAGDSSFKMHPHTKTVNVAISVGGKIKPDTQRLSFPNSSVLPLPLNMIYV
jgi:hypothetical protein